MKLVEWVDKHPGKSLILGALVIASGLVALFGAPAPWAYGGFGLVRDLFFVGVGFIAGVASILFVYLAGSLLSFVWNDFQD